MIKKSKKIYLEHFPDKKLKNVDLAKCFNEFNNKTKQNK